MRLLASRRRQGAEAQSGQAGKPGELDWMAGGLGTMQRGHHTGVHALFLESAMGWQGVRAVATQSFTANQFSLGCHCTSTGSAGGASVWTGGTGEKGMMGCGGQLVLPDAQC